MAVDIKAAFSKTGNATKFATAFVAAYTSLCGRVLFQGVGNSRWPISRVTRAWTRYGATFAKQD